MCPPFKKSNRHCFRNETPAPPSPPLSPRALILSSPLLFFLPFSRTGNTRRVSKGCSSMLSVRRITDSRNRVCCRSSFVEGEGRHRHAKSPPTPKENEFSHCFHVRCAAYKRKKEERKKGWKEFSFARFRLVVRSSRRFSRTFYFSFKINFKKKDSKIPIKLLDIGRNSGNS